MALRRAEAKEDERHHAETNARVRQAATKLSLIFRRFRNLGSCAHAFVKIANCCRALSQLSVTRLCFRRNALLHIFFLANMQPLFENAVDHVEKGTFKQVLLVNMYALQVFRTVF